MSSQEMENRPKETRMPKWQLNFFKLASQLSEIKRQGWVDRGITNPETVQDHSNAVALMSGFEARRLGLDAERTMIMALIHDLPEIFSGDITPHQHLPDEKKAEAILRWIPPSVEAIEDKHRKEEEAFRKIVHKFPLEMRTSITELWIEYNEGQTPEARLVKQMDLIQRLIQAEIYLDKEESFPIDSFVQEALGSDDPEVSRIAKSIQKKMQSNTNGNDVDKLPRKV